MPIHPSAIIDRSAEIDASVDVGPYAIIEPGVRIGADTRVYPHAYIARGTTLGRRCAVHPGAVVGHHPQDLAWRDAPSYTRIGDDVIIREHAQIHRGTAPESATLVGDRCYIMATGHVGHNCVLGREVKVSNSALLAGYIEVGDGAFLSGNTSLHQFIRIGELVIVGGGVRVNQDVPPFMMVVPEGVIGPNTIGMRRAGFSAAQRLEIREAYRLLYRSGLPFREAAARLAATAQSEPARRLVAFLQGKSKRGFLRYRGREAGESDE